MKDSKKEKLQITVRVIFRETTKGRIERTVIFHENSYSITKK